jgi:hypothetical protein
VGRVDEDQARVAVRQAADLVEVEAETGVRTQVIVAELQAERGRRLVERREARLGDDHVAAGRGGVEEQEPERLSGAGGDAHVVGRDARHPGDSLAQLRRALGRRVVDRTVEGSLPLLGIEQVEHLAQRPLGAGARREVELDRRRGELMLGEPLVKEEGSKLHGGHGKANG